jgi:hypothetical protein
LNVAKGNRKDEKPDRGQRHRDPIEVRVPGTELRLARDVLDKVMVDWRQEPLGRVDGLVLLAEPGRPPRVATLRSGPVVLARRLHRRVGRWAWALARRWGVRRGRAVRVAWSKVESVGLEVRLNLDARETGALALEDWLRDKVIGRIPGASFKSDKQGKD